MKSPAVSLCVCRRLQGLFKLIHGSSNAQRAFTYQCLFLCLGMRCARSVLKLHEQTRGRQNEIKVLDEYLAGGETKENAQCFGDFVQDEGEANETYF